MPEERRQLEERLLVFVRGLREGELTARLLREAGLTSETIWPGARGLEALTVHIDWITRIVNGAVSVPDGLRGSREAVEKLTAA